MSQEPKGPREPFRSPIPLALVEQLSPLVEDPVVWQALQAYLHLNKQNIMDSIGLLNMKAGIETIALEAAGFRAQIAFIQGLEVLPAVLREIRAAHQQYQEGQAALDAEDSASRQSFRPPNRLDLDNDLT